MKDLAPQIPRVVHNFLLEL